MKHEVGVSLHKNALAVTFPTILDHIISFLLDALIRLKYKQAQVTKEIGSWKP
jgi:hypothetical protein